MPPKISAYKTVEPLSPTKQYTYANDPFKSPRDADVILRTRDWVEFRVHRSILALASSEDERVLKIMQSSVDSPVPSTMLYDRKGRPILFVAEHSATLDLLLRIIYPKDDPPILDLSLAFSSLEAARRYGLTRAITVLQGAIARFAEGNPVRVYALAAQRGWTGEMNMSARATLGRDIQREFMRELRGHSYGLYESLTAYQKRCAAMATLQVTDLTWMRRIAKREGWRPCWAACKNVPACRNTLEEHPRWFQRYLTSVCKVLQTNPRGDAMKSKAIETAQAIAISEAARCRRCGHGAPTDLHKFIALLAIRVEETIETVCSSYLSIRLLLTYCSKVLCSPLSNSYGRSN